jgi:hypothetical protein
MVVANESYVPTLEVAKVSYVSTLIVEGESSVPSVGVLDESGGGFQQPCVHQNDLISIIFPQLPTAITFCGGVAGFASRLSLSHVRGAHSSTAVYHELPWQVAGNVFSSQHVEANVFSNLLLLSGLRVYALLTTRSTCVALPARTSDSLEMYQLLQCLVLSYRVIAVLHNVAMFLFLIRHGDVQGYSGKCSCLSPYMTSLLACDTLRFAFHLFFCLESECAECGGVSDLVGDHRHRQDTHCILSFSSRMSWERLTSAAFVVFAMGPYRRLRCPAMVPLPQLVMITSNRRWDGVTCSSLLSLPPPLEYECESLPIPQRRDGDGNDGDDSRPPPLEYECESLPLPLRWDSDRDDDDLLHSIKADVHIGPIPSDADVGAALPKEPSGLHYLADALDARGPKRRFVRFKFPDGREVQPGGYSTSLRPAKVLPLDCTAVGTPGHRWI